MAAIAGVVFLDGQAATAETVARLQAAAPPLATDSIGAWHAGNAALLCFQHARTPEAENEKQPHRNPETGNVIVFDGRLDNRSDVLARLSAALPTDAPDCALVLALFERDGDSFLEHLTGDYALAIWSPARQRLLCARSPVEWRPLLWFFDGARFAFATQPRMLIEGLGLPRQVNEAAVGEFLSLSYVTHDETLWQNVRRLSGGSALVVENGNVRSWVWNTGPFEDFSRLSEAETVHRFQSLFDDALVAATRSSTPIAAQLSGGLDSSSIVCRSHELFRAGRIAHPLRSITLRYPGEISDETAFSSAVEAQTGSPATVLAHGAYDFDEAAAWCRDTLQLPLRPNVLMPMASPLQRDGVRVLLTGEGGDDWLNGLWEHWPDLAQQGRWLQLLRESLLWHTDSSPTLRVRRLIARGLRPHMSAQRRQALQFPHLRMGGVPPWINPAWAHRIGLADRWRAAAVPVELPSYAQRQRYRIYAVARRAVAMENVVSFADKHGIELRHPFHDLKLTRFLMGVDGAMLRRGDTKKFLLREAMRGTLPETIRTRRDKASFSVKTAEAVAARLRECPVDDLLPVRMGWVESTPLKASALEWAAWLKAPTKVEPASHFSVVWFAIAADLWLRHAVQA
jgi:asparagine synthase (glutamine-hydrolysing)